MNPFISVIIPSALRSTPSGELWLQRAIGSVLAQTLQPQEILIGLDPGADLPESCWLGTSACPVRAINGALPGHQQASNAAAKAAKSPLLAFLEDDDVWLPNHLETLATAQDRFKADFIGASQDQIAVTGEELDTLDFPTASSWLLPRAVWQYLDGFDERFKIHHDNEFLGRLHRMGFKRVHLFERDAWLQARFGLSMVGKRAQIVRVEEMEIPTVRRTVHAESIIGLMKQNPARMQRSQKEYAALEILYGDIPW